MTNLYKRLIYFACNLLQAFFYALSGRVSVGTLVLDIRYFISGYFHRQIINIGQTSRLAIISITTGEAGILSLNFQLFYDIQAGIFHESSGIFNHGL